MPLIKKYGWMALGLAGGAVSGYLYWRYVGCVSGTCPITSNPVYTTAYGALLGSLLVSSVIKSKVQG